MAAVSVMSTLSQRGLAILSQGGPDPRRGKGHRLREGGLEAAPAPSQRTRPWTGQHGGRPGYQRQGTGMRDTTANQNTSGFAR